jgi:hypothetical protein
VVYVSDREQFVSKCLDIYGERTIEPGRQFTDQSSEVFVCSCAGVWLPKGSVTPGVNEPICSSQAAGKDEEQFVLPLRQKARVVAVKASAGIGAMDAYSERRFESLSAALKWVAAEEGKE